MKINNIFIGLVVATAMLSSCKNQDITYPDFDYQTVYFANQYPARTVELGEDLYVDNSMDNDHKVVIKATMGGTQDNKKNVLIDFNVNEALCSNIYFSTGAKVIPMPTTYYKLVSNQITIPSGSILGGVEVQLTDAFFADPLSLTNTYAIPLLMTNVQGADSILSGNPLISSPNRCVDANWSVLPKDFVLYTVKYVNPWHGNYLRRGVDQITNTSTGAVSSAVRHTQYVEKNDAVKITTTGMKSCTLPLSIKNSSGTAVPYTLVLTFANDGTCIVAGNSTNFDISGTGKFVSKGEKNSMGGIDRDGIYLDYSVNFKLLNLTYSTKDTLLVRDRAVAPEYFTVIKK